MTPSPVLITWVAVNNDPYERTRGKDGTSSFRLVDGQPVPGPTLTLLFDEESPYSGAIRDVVLLHRRAERPEDDREQIAVQETSQNLSKHKPEIRVHLEPWRGEDPTDHESIFEFLREKIPELRRRYTGRELLIHISPGTPSMQTIWVLMAETGFVEPPFRLVKSYRRADRRGRPAVVPVELGIETFYKVYKTSRPRQVSSEEQDVVLDPAKFRTASMRQLFTEARRFAHLKVPVILLGERGTGKTTLASWIRNQSPFRREERDADWPVVACGQYNPETMRAELFGYRKGAFTDAKQDKEGLLALANGDTLFLDEVGDVGPDLQRLLIKALEEKQFLPLGDDRPRKSDFRLLTATNIDDSELRKRLDPDFLDRITTLTLRLPPLREIRDELPWLWESTYEKSIARAGIPRGRALGATHHERIVSALARHPLPGNLRDLFRVAYRLLAARCDPHEPLPPADAVDYALQALTDSSFAGGDGISFPRLIARAFAESSPLDQVIELAGTIATKTVEQDLKAFLAQELRRVAKERGVPVERLCDRTDRALRTWADSSVKNRVPMRKKSSDKQR